MRIIEVPKAVLRLQYRVVRVPLQLIEQRVVGRLDAEAPGRLLYERSLGAVDAAVGNLLGDPELKERGDALAERSTALTQAAQLDAVADQMEDRAETELKQERERVASTVKEAQENKTQRTKEARVDAAKRKAGAVDMAEKRTDAAKRRADEAAERQKKAADAAKRNEDAKIAATQKAKNAVADAKRKDASQQRGEAAAERAEANRIEELADAEKERRREARSD
jgi:hypothetical protein